MPGRGDSDKYIVQFRPDHTKPRTKQNNHTWAQSKPTIVVLYTQLRLPDHRFIVWGWPRCGRHSGRYGGVGVPNRSNTKCTRDGRVFVDGYGNKQIRQKPSRAARAHTAGGEGSNRSHTERMHPRGGGGVMK